MQNVVFTIGHSTQPAEHFIMLLRTHGVTAVADVRSKPYSRMNPQYNREDLRAALGEAGVSYVFLGKEWARGARTRRVTAMERCNTACSRKLKHSGRGSPAFKRARKIFASLSCARKRNLLSATGRSWLRGIWNSRGLRYGISSATVEWKAIGT